jgi:hypothetical protein
LADLHITHPESFIRNYLNNGYNPIAANELAEAQKQKLGGWVKSLYESGIIDDELMSTCTPKEFHLLVATLFDQTLKACQSGVLAMDTIKGGLECKCHISKAMNTTDLNRPARTVLVALTGSSTGLGNTSLMVDP